MAKLPETVFVKPAAPKAPHERQGIIRDPRTLKALAPEGEEKPRSTYWLRRIRMGDVVVATATKAAAKPKPYTPEPAAPVTKTTKKAED